ncbi:TBC1 domain family member 20-like isoform X2 [Gigantopelta aegis]|uniref:TBC1 domain family member 20-like isoform X2 n=1 Tax=Gigantopelta aegis TaxID=1735272 RepID=UPI001B88E500|nr:TBC1 domain family member 20-like isoform X2 [Gigantopelta aegis]
MDDPFIRSYPALSKKQKFAKIESCVNSNPADVASLRQLSISRGGLLSNELRLKAWPKLLAVNVSDISPKPSSEDLQAHRDYSQVVMDVNRSLKRFPPGMQDDQRMALQDQLVDVIMRVLVKNPELHYYQGYHDICVTFLLVVGEDVAFALVEKLSINHLRDFMDSNMDRTKHMLNYLYPILYKANPELCEYMESAELGTIFSLSWLITWYGHVLNDFRHIVRLYDFFIACHPLMPIYLAAAIVLYREKEVLACECEMCFIHSLLSKIPDHLPFEQLIAKAGDLYLQFPPAALANEAIIKFRKSTALENSRKLQHGSRSQSSDSRVKKSKQNGKLLSLFIPDGSSKLMKVTVWTLGAVLSAAVFAVFNAAADWDWLEGRWW